MKASTKVGERKAEKTPEKLHAVAAVHPPEIQSWIQEFPGMALAGALLLGFIAGSAVSSRR